MPVFIYALCDPLSGTPRYIGKSLNPQRRLTYHLSQQKQGGNWQKKRWLSALREMGLRPTILILEVCTLENWCLKEAYWIRKYRGQTYALLNMTWGGDGPGCLDASQRARLSSLHKGVPKSAEHREKIRLAHLGRKHIGWKKPKPCSDERKKNISRALCGRKLTEEHKRKIGQAQIGMWIGRTISAEQRAKISRALIGRKLTAMHKEKIAQGVRRSKHEARSTAPTS